jgi:signal transduction histidine kinase
MKIRAKFSLSAILLIIIVIAGVSGLIFVAQRNLFLKEMRESQVSSLKGLANVSREFFITKNRIQLINYINQLKDIRAFLYAELIDSNARIAGHSDINLLEKVDASPQARKSLERSELFIQTYTDSRKNEVMDLSLPVFINNEKMGAARIGFSKTALDKLINENLKKTAKLILTAAVAALFIGIIGAVVLSGMMTDPMKKMAEGAALIGQGKLDTVINVATRDELGSLADDLNQMAQKLKELDQMKQDFVSSVTHELRSPLNSLEMYFDLFSKGQLGEISAGQKEALTFMKESTLRLTKFINDLLDTAKIERGKMEVTAQECGLEQIIDNVVRLYKVQADEKGIALVAEPGGGLPKIYADPDRTAQVLNNLVNNAIKFPPEKGEIKVKAKPEGGYVHVCVSDTGMGIPQDQIESVFDKFQQVKGVRDRIKGHKGTGLGLAIVKGLVEAQGGRIWVESEQGKGTTFHFTLPAV